MEHIKDYVMFMAFMGHLMSEMRADNTHYIRFEADRAQRQYEEVADFTNDEQNIVTDDMYYNCFFWHF